MGIREDYNNWPLGRQLQVIFITSGFILSLILVVITQFQLEWLRSQVLDNSTKVINDNLLTQMHNLGQLEANYIGTEFANYIATVLDLNRTDSIVLGFGFYSDTSPFVTGTPTDNSNYQSGVTDYTTGCFMSTYGDASGFPLSIKDTPMDQIYPLIYNFNYLYMYQGYETEELIHYYPAHLTTDIAYTPLVREWYYKAVAAPGTVIITEPYTDSDTGLWVVTVSTALIDLTRSVFGVAAADITLQMLTEKISKVQVLEQGFALLVSAGGMVLTMPASWGSTSTGSVRIFDTTTTGISQAQWTDIQALGPEDSYQFNDVNGTAYILTKNDVTPFTNLNNVTHYILLCANLIESQIPIQNISDNYARTYTAIFYITLAIGIFVFIGITILVYFSTRKVGIQLKMIEKLLSKLIRRGLFPTMTKGISCAKLEMNSKGIESLVDACQHRIQKIKDLENGFAYFNWGDTRPNDELLFTEWNSCLYPYNLHSHKQMNWRNILPNLSKLS